MNRRRNEPRTRASTVISLILFAVIAACGGIVHALFKNTQIQVNREIDAIERRCEQYKLDVRTTQMRMDQLLNRFVIRKQLEETGSSLVPIPLGIIEEVAPAPAIPHRVAAVP
jgi:hypothetical protein